MHNEETAQGPGIERPIRQQYVDPYYNTPPHFEPIPTYSGDGDIVIETHPTGVTKSVKISAVTGDDNIDGNPFYRTVWLARTVNEWRIFPRLFLIVYMWGLVLTYEWFMGLADPTMAQSTFVSTMIGAGAAWFGLYVGTGNRKSKNE